MHYNKFIATMYLGLMLSMSIFAANFTEAAELSPYSDGIEDINQTRVFESLFSGSATRLRIAAASALMILSSGRKFPYESLPITIPAL